MELSRVKPDDIVQVDRLGRRFFAIVTEKRRGEISFKPLTNGITYTTAKAKHVIGIYGRRKGSA